MNERFSRLRKLVEDAVGLEPEERDEWLEAACADDDELHQEARALIDAALADEGFLEPTVLRAPALVAGDQVGPYRLVRRLAAGGMGTVYEAERKEPRRRVALKLMRTGLHGADAASRFRYEVEVLARLQHPNVAALYETGVHVEDGLELPWFAMEYVEDARSLVRYAREEGLGLLERVALFADACDGVKHGHAHGVLHRDLKPENLLVDRDGRCRVIDFGVARATDADLGLATMRTTTGEIVGTLAYMSPEQVAGDRAGLDTRSDVYALGVVLYELLTGELPYPVRGTGTFAAMRTIRDAAPARPSAVLPALRGDLETILLKCLAKEPDRRYDSVAALADDLRRHLEHEPIAAHPPSVTYQLRVFARRHRALVAAGVVIVLVSVAAAFVSAAYALKAKRSERVAIEERDRSAEMFETLLTRSMDTNRRFVPRLMKLSGATPIVQEMTEANLADLVALQALATENPRARLEIAEAYLRYGQLQGDPGATTNLGDRAGTILTYERCLEIAGELYEEQPEDGPTMYLYACALGSLGYLKAFEQEHEESRSLLERAASLFSEYCRARPDDLRGAQAHADTLSRLSRTAAMRRDAEQEREYAESAHRLREDIAERWDSDPKVRRDLAHSHGQMAAVHARSGNLELALKSRRAAIAELEGLVDGDPGNSLYRQALSVQLRVAGDLEAEGGRLGRGMELAQRSVDLIVELREEDPLNRQLPMYFVLSHHSLARICEARVDTVRDPEERRDLLVRARDAYGAIVSHYEERGKSHSGFAAQVRERYEMLRSELGDE